MSVFALKKNAFWATNRPEGAKNAVIQGELKSILLFKMNN
jgi:hypothetical protein